MLFDVAIPEMPPAGVLIYESPKDILPSSRVIVEIGKRLHAGFILGRTQKDLTGIKAKPVEGIIDGGIIEPDIWDMALWAGNISMCGVSSALRAILPKQIIEGEKIKSPPDIAAQNTHFHERNYFNPFDSERVNFFAAELEKPERTLILFPSRNTAKAFYEYLPSHIKAESLLWPERNIFPAWKSAHYKQIRIVIGSAGAVFAPLKPQKIIIEDEANSSYVLPYRLNLSARSLAGRRALTLGAELITAGRIPSLKTYIRTKPEPPEIPERKNIILADIYHSRKETEHGIDGNIPLTFSLIIRTYRELAQGNNVLWILDRQGESSEVFCSHCGQSVKCSKCGHVMGSVNDGNILRCSLCGYACELPDKCGNCGSDFFMGKRPGIEALAKIVSKYYPRVKLYVKGSRKDRMKGLIISTQRGLELCNHINPSLVAWLDLDLELWRQDHSSRYNVYSMLYESYYRGRRRGDSRKVLIQARNNGMKTAQFLSEGWGKFIPDELKTRKDFMLPPYGCIVEVEIGGKIQRRDIITMLEDEGIFVMDSGDDSPLYMNVSSLETVRKILEPFSKYLTITVRSE